MAQTEHTLNSIRNTQENTYASAVVQLSEMFHLEADPDLIQRIGDYQALPEVKSIDRNTVKKLIEDERIYAWATPFREFIDLMDILFSDLNLEKQELLKEKFVFNRNKIEQLIQSINSYARQIHPGFQFLNMARLQKSFHGKGVKIVVFDLFDEDILEKQRHFYPGAKINRVQDFGNPVQLDHGNHVVDVILQIAPEVELIPVSADTESYTKAMYWIANDASFDIVNMSRAFVQSSTDKNRLDTEFRAVLKNIIQTKIFCKSLGNTGTDLNRVLNSHRVRLNLGPIYNIFSYDLELIKDLSHELKAKDLLVFSENLTPFVGDMSITATIPGHINEIKNRTLSVPAEGVWGETMHTFESGSSFAAPQISAISALLLEALKTQNHSLTAIEKKHKVVEALKQSAQRFEHSESDWGQGLLNSDLALKYLEGSE